jgi:D-amino-acid dehydrogenase
MFPPLGRVWRALHNPFAARVDGRLLCRAVREAAEHRGVRFVAMEATGVERRDDRVVAVRGADDVVPCGALVLAGGAWSGGVTGWLGTELPVTPTKGQIVHVVLPGDVQSTRWPIVQPILNFYLVPWPGGRVACGGTFEPEAGFDVRPTAAGVRDLLRECVTIAPGLGDATVLEVRVGLRPTSADDRPLLGPVPGLSNVHVCTGHGANGLLLGSYSAALVAAGVIGPGPDTVVPYSVARVFSA